MVKESYLITPLSVVVEGLLCCVSNIAPVLFFAADFNLFNYVFVSLTLGNKSK